MFDQSSNYERWAALTDPQTTLTPEQITELVADHHSGIPTDELATEYAIHRPTIVRHLNRHESDFALHYSTVEPG